MLKARGFQLWDFRTSDSRNLDTIKIDPKTPRREAMEDLEDLTELNDNVNVLT